MHTCARTEDKGALFSCSTGLTVSYQDHSIIFSIKLKLVVQLLLLLYDLIGKLNAFVSQLHEGFIKVRKKKSYQ